MPKAVLLEWVNNFLQLNLEKVEQMATGACYCNLFDALHPKTVPMNRVDFAVKYDYEYSKNWKLLQNAFLKVGIKKQIPVERLTKARYQDNLEFLQWFYKYAHDTYPGDCDNPDYDAVSSRNRAKGGRDFRFSKNKNNGPNQRNIRRGGRGKENMKNYNGHGGAPRSARGHGPYGNKGYNSNNNNNNNAASSASVGSMRGNSGSTRRRGNGNNGMRNNSISSMNSMNSMSMSSMNGNGMNNHSNSNNSNNNNNNNNSVNEYEFEQLREDNNKLASNNDKLKKQIETLNHEHVELRNVAKDIEKERDFYFNKVLQVESICKQHPDQAFPLLKSIYDVCLTTYVIIFCFFCHGGFVFWIFFCLLLFCSLVFFLRKDSVIFFCGVVIPVLLQFLFLFLFFLVLFFQILYQNDETVEDGNNGNNDNNDNNVNNDNRDGQNGTPPLRRQDDQQQQQHLQQQEQQQQQGMQGEIRNGDFDGNNVSKMEDVTMGGQQMNQENAIAM